MQTGEKVVAVERSFWCPQLVGAVEGDVEKSKRGFENDDLRAGSLLQAVQTGIIDEEHCG